MSLDNFYVLGWFSMFVTWNKVGSRKNKQNTCSFETDGTLCLSSSFFLSMSTTLMFSNPCMMFLSCVYALCVWMKCLEYLHLGIKCAECVLVCSTRMLCFVCVCKGVGVYQGCLSVFLCMCVCAYTVHVCVRIHECLIVFVRFSTNV